MHIQIDPRDERGAVLANDGARVMALAVVCARLLAGALRGGAR